MNKSAGAVVAQNVVRRCTSVTFSQDEKYVIISDKSGDVYRYIIEQQPDEQRPTEQKQDEQRLKEQKQDEQKQCSGELLLGHLSMVLDLVLVKNDKYLVTCDKDEKIRISCYPNSYNIHSFCLGHTQFVNSLIYEEETELLISGSGDCTIRLWDYNGQQQYCQQCQCQISDTTVTTKDTPYIKCMSYSPKHKLLVVGFGNNKSIEIYRLKREDKELSLELVQCIDIEKDLLDIVVNDDKLYILQPIQDNCILVYNIIGHTGQQKLTLCTDEKTTPFFNKLNSLKEFFSGCLDLECIYPNLRKSRTDNMAEYLQRKEKRIHGEKLEPPTYNEKKPKLS
ncbi:hypothetical protein LOTGIDRAFT_172070 [Lottia gigantea]|uniref:Uncharacterized protein n=1 Tax=Lottia gigantea TaxID=225164 RepID=V4AXY3_LOTGI|nr:hypothetical protein LOTGIDRAFT_172070 [Lottia gigantea]ESP02413.1 hypothetical protein LOTGIDRAFT_172070 [Lottia gigantea]